MAKRVFKAGKKLSGTAKQFRKWDEWSEGDVLIGKYVGNSTDNYDKPCWHFLVEDAQFSDKKAAKALIGKTFGANSAGKLNKAMEDAEEGEFYQLTYNGMGEIASGKYAGKESHDIDVVHVTAEGDEEESEEDEEDFDL